jgi:hypothetical protein
VRGRGRRVAEMVEGRGQRAEGRGQRAEGRGQRAEGRGQRAEGKGQRAEGRGQRAEGRGQREGGGRRTLTRLGVLEASTRTEGTSFTTSKGTGVTPSSVTTS